MKSKCNLIQPLLSDYIDGILSKGQVKKIDQHLASCSKCRTALSLLEKTNRMLDLYIEQKPPNGYFNKVWIQIKGEITERLEDGYLKMIKDNLSLRFRMLRNKLYDEFIWWADRIRWSKLLWQSVMVILLVFSAIVVDRTYFRPSIDKAFLQKITQSLSKDGFYLIRYTPKPMAGITENRSRKTDHGKRIIEDTLLKIQKIPNFTEHPSVYSAGNSVPSVIGFENSFLAFINIEIFNLDKSDNHSQKDLFSFVNLSNPKNMTRVKITNVKGFQLQISTESIQDIQQSFIRRKDRSNENPFRAFLTDVQTSGLSFKIFN